MFAINHLSHAVYHMLTYIRYVDVNFTFALVDRTFHGWSGHHWKERLNFSKIAQFESDSSQANEDVAPQSSENL